MITSNMANNFNSLYFKLIINLKKTKTTFLTNQLTVYPHF